MDNLEIGKEYLFSDNKRDWTKGELEVITDIESDLFPYFCKSGIWFTYIKPLEKPERKLYTQSMKDAGKPIEVGMWFLNAFGEDVECVLGADIKGKIAYIQNGESYFTMPKGAVPFPDPVKLEDGEAYEFDYMNKTRKGVYEEEYDRFVFINGWARSTASTNIKHLTVAK